MTDQDVTLTELSEHILPFGRRVRLVNADYHNGLNMLRLIWREGKRITQVEVDPENAAALGRDLLGWANDKSPDPKN
jgi:hypothetical protein